MGMAATPDGMIYVFGGYGSACEEWAAKTYFLAGASECREGGGGGAEVNYQRFKFQILTNEFIFCLQLTVAMFAFRH